MDVRMKNRRVGVPSTGACALLVSVAALACDKVGAPAAAPSAEHELIGAKAPDFELSAQGGGSPLSPVAHTGQVVIVDFWATWCAPCKDSFPFYQSLTDKYGDQLAVLAVSVDEEPAGIADFVAETKVTFPVAWDEDQSVTHLYKPETMPTSYLVDRNGVVQYVHAGFKSGDADGIVQHIEQLLK